MDMKRPGSLQPGSAKDFSSGMRAEFRESPPKSAVGKLPRKVLRQEEMAKKKSEQ